MNGMVKRMGVGLGAVALALVLAGMAFLGGHHLSAQGPGGGGPAGRFGGPGGPGRPGGPMGRGGPGLLGPMMFGRLDLSQDQRDRLKQILDSHRDEQKALADRAMAAHAALEAAIEGGTFDEATVRARAADVAAVDADQGVARARIFSEALQILTADQQSKLKAMQAERKERLQKRQTRRRG